MSKQVQPVTLNRQRKWWLHTVDVSTFSAACNGSTVGACMIDACFINIDNKSASCAVFSARVHRMFSAHGSQTNVPHDYASYAATPIALLNALEYTDGTQSGNHR